MIIFTTFLNLLTILYFFIFYFASGLIFYNYINNSSSSKKQISIFEVANSTIICGLLITYLILSIWNLFLPINPICLLLFTALTLISLIKHIHQLHFIFHELIKSKLILLPIALLIIFSIWIACLSNSEIGPSDFGRNHLQAIKWAMLHPTVKGIGNLFWGLGLSCNSWISIALHNNINGSNFFLWNHSGFLLVLAFSYFVLIPIESVIKQKSLRFSNFQIYRLFFFIPLIQWTFYLHPGTSSDLPVYIFSAILSIELFEYIIIKDRTRLSNILLVICLGITSKLSFTFMAIVVALLILPNIVKQLSNKNFRAILLICFLSIFVFMLKNTIMTGYPLFPYHGLSIPVKWKMDQKTIIDITSSMKDWANGIKKNGLNENERKSIRKEWIKSRLLVQHRRIETSVPLALGSIGLIFIILFRKKVLYQYFLFILPASIQIFIWFFLFPDNRFSGSAFWWFGAGCGSYLIYNIKLFQSKGVLLGSLIVIAFSTHLVDSLGQEKIFFPSKLGKNIKKIKVNVFTTNSGVELYSPEDNQNCWDAPLPCTPYFNPTLSIIDNNINSGFYIEH